MRSETVNSTTIVVVCSNLTHVHQKRPHPCVLRALCAQAVCGHSRFSVSGDLFCTSGSTRVATSKPKRLAFTYAILHAELRKLLAALYGRKRAAAYSWHSFRIGFACLAFCRLPRRRHSTHLRWASPASLKVTGRWALKRTGIDRARAAQSLDATRVNNLPRWTMTTPQLIISQRLTQTRTERQREPRLFRQRDIPNPGRSVFCHNARRQQHSWHACDVLNNFWAGTKAFWHHKLPGSRQVRKRPAIRTAHGALRTLWPMEISSTPSTCSAINLHDRPTANVCRNSAAYGRHPRKWDINSQSTQQPIS